MEYQATKTQTYLDILKRLDLTKNEDFLIYCALQRNIKIDYEKEIAKGRSEPFSSYLNKLSNFVPEFSAQGWEMVNFFEHNDFYSMQSLDEVREECIKIRKLSRERVKSHVPADLSEIIAIKKFNDATNFII